MFTSGKFKNAVGCADDTVLIVPGASLQKRYILTPIRGPARQWLALEEAFGREPVLAPTTILDKLVGTEVVIPPPQSGKTRNVFAIIVSYYVKVSVKKTSISLFLLHSRLCVSVGAKINVIVAAANFLSLPKGTEGTCIVIQLIEEGN